MDFTNIIDLLLLAALIAMVVLIVIFFKKKNFRMIYIADCLFMTAFSAWGIVRELIHNRFEWREHWTFVMFFFVFAIFSLVFFFGKPKNEDTKK